MTGKFVFAALGREDQYGHVQGSEGDGTLHPEERRFINRLVSKKLESGVHANPEDEDPSEEHDKFWTGRPPGEATHEALQPRRLALMLVTQFRERSDRAFDMC
jgi:hypothetical protein